MTHSCITGCGRRITYQFAICVDCEQIYGNRTKSWPAWLAFLWRDMARERRRRKRQGQHEIILDLQEIGLQNGYKPDFGDF